MFVIVAALWTTETTASGIGLGPATQVNLPFTGWKEMVINNETGHPIMLNYFNTANVQMVRSIDGRTAMSSNDTSKRSDAEKKSWNAEFGISANGSPAGEKAPGPGGAINFAYGESNERATSSEMGAQRGNEQSQNVGFSIDDVLRTKTLHFKLKVPVGLDSNRFTRADEGYWQVSVYDEMGQRLLAENAIGYDSNYIIITQDYRIKPKEEVPEEALKALTPPCTRCLPIEDKSLGALRKLAETHIHVNGRHYVPAGPGTWRTQDHPSFIKAPISYIGSQTPFLLFKMGDSSYDWFMQHSAEQRERLLKRLKNYGEAGPGFDLGKHLQLVRSPSTFSLAGKPIQIFGDCPGCSKMPNPIASQ